jgi:twitching motility protein PilT
VSQFALLVPYLESEDIAEIVLETGKPPTVKMAGEYSPISKGTMTTAQIEALIAGTPIAPLVPRSDTDGAAHRVVLEGRPHLVRVVRRGDVLQISVEHARAAPAARPAARPASRADAPPSVRPAARPSARPAPRADARPASRPSTRPAGPPSARPAARPQLAPAARPAVAPPPATPPAAVVAPAVVAPAVVAPAVVPSPAPAPVPAPVARAEALAPALPVSGGVLVGRLTGILAAARERRASDVHIVSDRPVLVRTAGELVPSGEPLPHAAVEAMLLPLLDPRRREALETRGYVDLGAEGEGAGRLRVNVSRQKTGLKGSFRLVMEPLPSLESLGLPAELAKVTTYHQGLVVIAGPSGHGKTTTLAAIVDIINASRPHHILTVEEPVEFIHPPKRALVSQRDVGLHTRSFAAALKASLREDPDVIVIGELRDRETVEIAMTAAETGHLVMATMSTPSAAKTIDRLIDLFPPEDQQQVRVTLAGALKFVVAQRLLPNVAGDSFVAVVELITGNVPLWAMIRDNKLFHLPNLQQRGRSFGMIRFDDSLIELARAGKITEETALAHAENKKELTSQLRGERAPAPPAAAAPQAPQAPQARLGDLAARARSLFGGKG